ncbi:MAG: cysteine desulfurase family protein [Caulobacteraceae bacterium]|nr:cysteine desulfurase family protein [Caulobacteraceae bacterium]
MTTASKIYLDYNATAPIRPEAADAVICALGVGGNPSSVHAAGRMARAAVERARGQVARLVGVKDGSVTFTSGGTEANALAIASAIAAGARRPVVGLTEHASALENAMAPGFMVEGWPVLQSGLADLDWLETRLKAWEPGHGRPFVVVSLANSETGVIQPIAQIAALVRAADGWLHVDAVQAAGKIPVDFTALGADTLSLSGHKLGGPHGTGALVAGTRSTLTRQLHGGGQERGRRSGTENVSGIAGFGAAAAAAQRDLDAFADHAAWRDAAQAAIEDIDGVQVFGLAAPRLPSVLSFAAEDFESERQVIAMDLEGVMVSAGAACSSGKVSASPVLAAMGYGPLAANTLRVSGGWATTPEDWTRFAEVWSTIHDRFRARRRASAA